MSSDQMPAPGKTKLIKFPPFRAGKDGKCPGYAPQGGGDVEASIWLMHYLASETFASVSEERRIVTEVWHLEGKKYKVVSEKWQIPPSKTSLNGK